MNCSIFIRTYEKDLKWLQLALKSIYKYVTGFDKIVVCIPENQIHKLHDFNLPNIIACPVYEDDYLGQQVSKLMSDVYCNSDYVLFTDSDCIFYRPFDCKDLLKDGKPVIYKTKYDKVGEGIVWKDITEKALNKEVEYEYMRRLPLLYKRSTLSDLRDYIHILHGRTLEGYIISRPYRQFSEFNVLGAFAELYCPEEYYFHDTDLGIEEPYLKQFWSWSNLTDTERMEIQNMIG